MMILKKRNRIIRTESEKEKERYLKDGYDVINEKGKIVEYATGGKTYTAKQYNELLDKIDKLEKKLKRRNA